MFHHFRREARHESRVVFSGEALLPDEPERPSPPSIQSLGYLWLMTGKTAKLKKQ